MQKTSIDWATHSWNPIRGICQWHRCLLPNGQEYCYAKKHYTRFKLNPRPRIDKLELAANFFKIPIGSRIFVCSTHELFGDWIPNEWIKQILDKIEQSPYHAFIILTKNPLRAASWDMPPNVWMGASIDNRQSSLEVPEYVAHNFAAHVRFISFEPLLEPLENLRLEGLSWVVIGGLSGERSKKNILQRQQWAMEIMKETKQLSIPIFVKNNLRLASAPQEFPR